MLETAGLARQAHPHNFLHGAFVCYELCSNHVFNAQPWPAAFLSASFGERENLVMELPYPCQEPKKVQGSGAFLGC